jgi:uncharacterized protein
MNSNNRVTIVDALRGFALLGIILIHYVEHFDFFARPEVNFIFSADTNDKVMQAVFFLISGKAYSIFALMFGFSFFIQIHRKEEVGIDFRATFFWRLCVLLCLGFLHSLVYKGDILHIYAILGMVLILLYKVSTKVLVIIAALLVLQVPLIYQLILSFVSPDFMYIKTFGEGLWEQADKVYATGSFYDVVNFNLWKGRTTVWGWTYYNGRYLQLLALFIVGMIVGRKQIFEKITQHSLVLIRILILSILLFAMFAFSYKSITISNFSDTQKMLISTLINSYANLAFTMVLLCVFILIYIGYSKHFLFNYLASYGRLSLSNYIIQALFGVIFFFGFGFGMYKLLGSAWSIMLGFIVFTSQVFISKLWLKHFYYGPFEWLWRALTFLDFDLKFRKEHKIELSA